jgi:hypothetical protein
MITDKELLFMNNVTRIYKIVIYRIVCYVYPTTMAHKFSRLVSNSVLNLISFS